MKFTQINNCNSVVYCFALPQGHSIWSKKGPVVIIKSQGVVLKNLQVEVTGNQAKLTDVELCSLAVQPEARPTLDSVTVRGDVVGLEGEEGAWGYPTAINMGSLKANVSHTFKLSLLVPVPCRFSCDISGISILPGGVSGGNMAELTLKIDPLAAGTRLRGSILVKSGALVRRIAVGANVARAQDDAGVIGDGKILWKPAPEPEPPTEVSTSSQLTRKVEPKKTKVKKTDAKKVTKKITTLPKGKKKKAASADSRLPANDGKSGKSRDSDRGPIPAHLPEEPPKPPLKPVVPDNSAQAFKTKSSSNPKPQLKKPNTSNKKQSGIPTGGAFAKVPVAPVAPVQKTENAEDPKKKTESSPIQQKKEASPSVTKGETSYGDTQTKTRYSSAAPRKPRKSTVIKSDFAGGAFTSKPKSYTETSVKKEVDNKPPVKEKPAKNEAPAAKEMPKIKEPIKKPLVKKKMVKRVHSQGLGSVWGESKQKK